MNRRNFLKGIAGISAAGILLPGEEQVKRFWRGWSPDALSATAPQLTIGDYDLASPYAHLDKGETVFVLDDRATGRGQFAIWTGDRFVPQIPAITGKLTPFPESPRSSLQLHQPGGGFPGPHGFSVVDLTDHRIPTTTRPDEEVVPDDPFPRQHSPEGQAWKKLQRESYAESTREFDRELAQWKASHSEPMPYVTTHFALGIGDDGMRLIDRGMH